MRERSSIASLFKLDARFVRSVNLERDFNDARALDGYVLVPTLEAAIDRIVSGLRPSSGQRAWRITGDYGAGKSSFGVALARLLSGDKQTPPWLEKALSSRRHGVEKPRMFPVLVTGSREGLAAALSRALLAAIDALHRDVVPAELQRIKKRVLRAKTDDRAALEALTEFCSFVVSKRKRTGVLLVIDEMGKLLEFAALHPDRSDVYLLQQLAEHASRSGDRPLVVVGLLHQGFRAYADALPVAAQQEWAKVAGRFEEILFDQPLENVAALAVRALNITPTAVDRDLMRASASELRKSASLGWYGAATLHTANVDGAGIYPLHPTVLPVAVRFLRRFGQNERSFFGLLLSDEPFGVQAFSHRAPGPKTWYRVSDFYDYVRANWGHSLGGRSYQSQWLRIVEIIDGSLDLSDSDRDLLKTVGLLNLLDSDDLRATAESIAVCVGISDSAAADAVKRLREARMLFDRGSTGGLCLWPHSSVDLERARELAEQALGPVDRVSPLLAAELDTTPVVARRHYVERGTLRHFEVRYVAASQARDALRTPLAADGLLLILLPDTRAEHAQALQYAQCDEVRARPEVIVGVSDPVSGLAGVVQDVQCWQWVLRNTPELTHDRYAAAEVVRQVEAAKLALAERASRFVGFANGASAVQMRWFHCGLASPIYSARELLRRVSEVCDDLYADGPFVTNELLNRRSLSSAAARARTLLIEAILERADKEGLGLPTAKAPPERAVYLSILQAGRVHRAVGRSYAIAEPANKDPLNLKPSLRRIRDILRTAGDGRVTAAAIMAELRRPPYGIRDGLIPLILAIYVKAHEHELAFYEDGAFITRLTGAEFLRLTKAPDSFAIQYCRVEGIRSEVFEQLLAVLDLTVPADRSPELLDVVTPLCEFAARLPPFTARTNRTSARSRAVRDALVRAEEPGPLLFVQLPRACGLPEFDTSRSPGGQRVTEFVAVLRGALDELRDAYSALLQRIVAAIGHSFGLDARLESLRAPLARRAQAVMTCVREPRLKGFCLRLADAMLPADRWIESVASFVREKPPERWLDGDEAAFAESLAALADTFRRVESMAFGRDGVDNPSAVRVVLTRADGTERNQVLHLTDVEVRMADDLVVKLVEMLRPHKHIGLVAATRIVWDALAQNEVQGGVSSAAPIDTARTSAQLDAARDG